MSSCQCSEASPLQHMHTPISNPTRGIRLHALHLQPVGELCLLQVAQLGKELGMGWLVNTAEDCIVVGPWSGPNLQRLTRLLRGRTTEQIKSMLHRSPRITISELEAGLPSLCAWGWIECCDAGGVFRGGYAWGTDRMGTDEDWPETCARSWSKCQSGTHLQPV